MEEQNGLPSSVLPQANPLHGLPSGLPSRLTPPYPRVIISTLQIKTAQLQPIYRQMAVHSQWQ